MEKTDEQTAKKNIQRFKPTIENGLSNEQVNERISQKKVNYDSSVPTKSIKQILFDNFVTIFNILNLVLGIAIFAVGSYKNMTFLLVVICNVAISTFQELHSKKIVDKLAIMAQSKVKVVRDGKQSEISIHELVLDDVVIFNTGNQIPTDCIILDGEVLSNESFITGEPDSITKVKGEMLLSGSYLVGGKCVAKVEHIGDENYTAQISSGAKYVKKVKSEIMVSLNKIIKWLTFAIIPIGILLFITQTYVGGLEFKEVIVKTTAAIIGMIPEGLVLLTSTVLAVSVVRLSRSKVLVQELFCIETLARVDTLCLDKTGTLTEGRMEVSGIIGINEDNSLKDLTNLKNIIANFAKVSDDENPTMQAIKAYFANNIVQEFKVSEKVAFSSKTKWSGINFDKEGSYVIGAPEFILKDNFAKYEKEIVKYSENYRVLLLAHSNSAFNNKDLPNNIEAVCLILISDVIRKEASKTLEYFRDQDVNIKIISGDNPITVSKIAKQVGVENAENYIDMSTLKTEKEVEEAAIKYTVFGRVSPTQKKELVVALQKNGKTVAMTGDGVNDVLALKTADCSIAMANGSDATKSVSQLILLDSNFASMPKVVAEGRRTINNIERSASLFLVKTIYSSILAVLFLFLSTGYPFQPVHVSLISIVTIGIPSFILALEPNKERIHGRFLKNVFSKAIPSALTSIISILAIALAIRVGRIEQQYYSTLCVISVGITGIILLITLARTRKSEHSKFFFSPFRLILAFLLAGLFILGLTVLNWYFSISELTPILPQIVRIALLNIFNFIIIKLIVSKILKV